MSFNYYVLNFTIIYLYEIFCGTLNGISQEKTTRCSLDYIAQAIQRAGGTTNNPTASSIIITLVSFWRLQDVKEDDKWLWRRARLAKCIFVVRRATLAMCSSCWCVGSDTGDWLNLFSTLLDCVRPDASTASRIDRTYCRYIFFKIRRGILIFWEENVRECNTREC